MTTTRSSASRKSGSISKDESSQNAGSAKGQGRTKRTSDAPTPQAKRSKLHEKVKQQKSIEETMLKEGRDDDSVVDNDDDKPKAETREGNDETSKNETTKSREQPESDQQGSAIIEDPQRAEVMPSTILEKGIIYFFFRARVGIDEPQGVKDIARSYLVLRPLPLSAKLGEGPLEETHQNRLLALPKKVLPVSHQDRFMTFAEKVKTTMQDLKENFLDGSDYETKTFGTRHAPAVTPSGEGVYAITSTGQNTHLSYILTVPSEVSEVQQELGLRQRASFVVSVKNPEVGGPANTNLPNPAKYSQDIMDAFRGRGWMPLQAGILDYENAQILLIGEQSGEISKAMQPSEKDQKHHKETPLEEMEKLEHEDDIRIQHLKGDDPVLEDLGLSSQEHSKLQATW